MGRKPGEVSKELPQEWLAMQVPGYADGRFVRVDIVLEVGNYQGKAWGQYGDADNAFHCKT